MFLKSAFPHSICDPITHTVLKTGKPNRKTVLDESRPLAIAKDDHISSRGGRGEPISFPSSTSPGLPGSSCSRQLFLAERMRQSIHRAQNAVGPLPSGAGVWPLPRSPRRPPSPAHFQGPEVRLCSGSTGATGGQHSSRGVLGAKGVRGTESLAKALPFRRKSVVWPSLRKFRSCQVTSVGAQV